MGTPAVAPNPSQSAPPPPAADPYAAFGGSISTASTGTTQGNPGTPPPDKPGMTPLNSTPAATGAGSDPYAEFGGSVAAGPAQASAGPLSDSQRQTAATGPAQASAGPLSDSQRQTAVSAGVRGAVGGIPGVPSGAAGVVTGILRHAAQTVQGVNDIAEKIWPSETENGTPEQIAGRQDNFSDFAHSDAQGADEMLGGAAEDVAEYLAGDALLKGAAEGVKLTASAKYKAVADGLKTIEKLPDGLRKVVVAAIKNGSLSGAQTYVKSGGDAGAAAAAAGLGAGAGALGEGIGALGGKVASAAAARTPVTKTIEGVEHEVAPEIANAKPTPQMEAAGQSLKNAARGAGEDSLERVNATRQATPEFDERGEPTGKMTRPTLKPVNAQEAMRGAETFGEASQRAQDSVKPVYEALNEATDGEFNKLRDARSAAFKAGDIQAGQAAEAQMQALFDDAQEKWPPKEGAPSLKDFQAARQVFADSHVLDAVDRVVDNATVGSIRSGTYLGLKGDALESGLKRMEQKYGFQRVQQALGPERLANLYKLARYTANSTKNAQFNAAVKNVVQYMGIHAGAASVGGYAAHLAGVPWEVGAGAGIAAAKLGPKVINAVLTRPALTRQLLFAIDSGARPEFYAPFIANLISNPGQQTGASQ